MHNMYKFSINRPVFSCLFLSSLKRTQDIKLSPHPPPHSHGSLLCLSSRSFLLPAGLASSHNLSQRGAFGRGGGGVPGENL